MEQRLTLIIQDHTRNWMMDWPDFVDEVRDFIDLFYRRNRGISLVVYYNHNRESRTLSGIEAITIELDKLNEKFRLLEAERLW